MMTRIGFMASHGGSGMKSVLQAQGQLLVFDPVVFIGNNQDAAAFSVAKYYHLPCSHLNSKTHPDPRLLDRAICDKLQEYQVDLLILSGYMKKVGPQLLATFENRILNIHPSLLPKYGGQGMYGDRVHQAVLENHETETGASVHIVTPEYDQGPVLKQAKVAVNHNDTLDTVREKVKSIEGHLYIQTLQEILNGQLALPGFSLKQ